MRPVIRFSPICAAHWASDDEQRERRPPPRPRRAPSCVTPSSMPCRIRTGQQQPAPASTATSARPTSSGGAEAVQQPAQAVRPLGAHRARLVDVGGVGGGRQRGDLGEQFGGRRASPGGAAGVAAAPSCADPQLGGDAPRSASNSASQLAPGARGRPRGAVGGPRRAGGRVAGAAQLVGVGQQPAVERASGAPAPRGCRCRRAARRRGRRCGRRGRGWSARWAISRVVRPAMTCAAPRGSRARRGRRRRRWRRRGAAAGGR